VSRKCRRPFRFENGCAKRASVGGGSLEVTAVRPLEPVALETLLDRFDRSPLAAAARDSADWRTFLRSELVPEVEEDFRWDCALPLTV
jgi:hypothetical protein